MDNQIICALTFDDGPSKITSRILDILEKNGCRASFFVCGHDVFKYSTTVKRAHALGCTIENHTWAHKNLNRMDFEDILAAFYSTQFAVKETVGEAPKFLRAPGLGVNDLVFEVIPVPLIGGVCGTPDWNSRDDDPATSNLEDRVEGIINTAKDGAILLMHDCEGNYLTPDALEIALPKLVAKGIKFVNIRELFELKGVSPEAHAHIQWANTSDKV